MEQKNEHITQETLTAFNQGQLGQEDYLKALAHISSCDKCAELYALSLSEEDMVPAPHYLKSEIMSKVHKKTFLESLRSKFSSNNGQLLVYSLKVSIAMCGAILFLFSGLLNQDTHSAAKKIPVIKMETINHVNDKLYEFSNKLIKTEVNYYDKEKK